MTAMQVAQLQAEAREAAHLQRALADKEGEIAGLRAHLEEALREELADSDPARLRAAQKRAAALEADLAAKQVLLSSQAKHDQSTTPCQQRLQNSSTRHSQAKAAAYSSSPVRFQVSITPLQGVCCGQGQICKCIVKRG